jgi:hypothetical protein
MFPPAPTKLRFLYGFRPPVSESGILNALSRYISEKRSLEFSSFEKINQFNVLIQK